MKMHLKIDKNNELKKTNLKNTTKTNNTSHIPKTMNVSNANDSYRIHNPLSYVLIASHQWSKMRFPWGAGKRALGTPLRWMYLPLSSSCVEEKRDKSQSYRLFIQWLTNIKNWNWSSNEYLLNRQCIIKHH